LGLVGLRRGRQQHSATAKPRPAHGGLCTFHSAAAGTGQSTPNGAPKAEPPASRNRVRADARRRTRRRTENGRATRNRNAHFLDLMEIAHRARDDFVPRSRFVQKRMFFKETINQRHQKKRFRFGPSAFLAGELIRYG